MKRADGQTKEKALQAKASSATQQIAKYRRCNPCGYDLRSDNSGNRKIAGLVKDQECGGGNLRALNIIGFFRKVNREANMKYLLYVIIFVIVYIPVRYAIRLLRNFLNDRR